jgi:hypothetical protein
MTELVTAPPGGRISTAIPALVCSIATRKSTAGVSGAAAVMTVLLLSSK